MGTGSAPIKPETQQFMKILMSCPLYEGYGQTECCIVAFFQHPDDPTYGHVGGVVVSLHLILEHSLI